MRIKLLAINQIFPGQKIKEEGSHDVKCTIKHQDSCQALQELRNNPNNNNPENEKNQIISILFQFHQIMFHFQLGQIFPCFILEIAKNSFPCAWQPVTAVLM